MIFPDTASSQVIQEPSGFGGLFCLHDGMALPHPSSNISPAGLGTVHHHDEVGLMPWIGPRKDQQVLVTAARGCLVLVLFTH